MDRERYRKLLSRLSGEQNHRCCYCGVRTEKTERKTKLMPTIEHVWDRSNNWLNLAMACWRCNNMRLNDVCPIVFYELRCWRFKDRQQMFAYFKRIGLGG